MLACNRLRIDPGDGSPVVDYRIENGSVESRTLETAAESSTATAKEWQRLTLEQLSSHVMAETVVAHWLHRRMGVHRLIRACTQHSSSAKTMACKSAQIESQRENALSIFLRETDAQSSAVFRGSVRLP
jgi:hypothetical protein